MDRQPAARRGWIAFAGPPASSRGRRKESSRGASLLRNPDWKVSRRGRKAPEESSNQPGVRKKGCPLADRSPIDPAAAAESAIWRSRSGRDHRRRSPPRSAHAHLRRRRLRQDALRDGVPGPRRHRVRRAGRLHGLRGDGRGARRERRLARLRPPASWRRRRSSPSTTCASSAARSRRPASTTSRVSSSASSYAIETRRRQARRARHDRVAVQRAAQPGGAALRAAAALPLAQGPRA